MNYFDLLAWVCAPSGTDALEIWKHCNPDKSQIWYTFDPTIKAFWKSRIGQATLWGNRPRNEILRIPHYWRLVKWKGGKALRVIACLTKQDVIKPLVVIPQPIAETITIKD